jgi:hypothetical protein
MDSEDQADPTDEDQDRSNEETDGRDQYDGVTEM